MQIKKHKQIYDFTFALLFNTRNNQIIFNTAQRKQTIITILTQLSMIKKLTVQQITVQPNYVYMLLSIPPTVTISTVIKNLKAVSARRWFNHYRQSDCHHLWDNGYYIATSGQPDCELMRQQLNKKGNNNVKTTN